MHEKGDEMCPVMKARFNQGGSDHEEGEVKDDKSDDMSENEEEESDDDILKMI